MNKPGTYAGLHADGLEFRVKVSKSPNDFPTPWMAKIETDLVEPGYPYEYGFGPTPRRAVITAVEDFFEKFGDV